MHRRRPLCRAAALVSCALVIVACQPVAPHNPWDPDADADEQARARVEGQVKGALHDASLTLLEGADVVLRDRAGAEVARASSDEAGAFTLPDLVPGDYVIEAVHAGYRRDTRELSLLPGEVRAIELHLDARGGEDDDGAHLFGVAHKSGQLALPEAERDHSGILVEVIGPGVRTVTARDGRFDLYLTPATYELSFSAPGYLATTLTDVAAGVGETELPDGPVVLAPNPGTLSGAVVLEGVEDAAGHGGVLVSVAGGTTVTTGDDGRFTVPDLAAGTYTLSLARDGYEEARVGAVVVAAGRETDVGTVPLAIARGAVEGQATLAGALDHAGTLVTLSGTAFATQTTSDGRFTIVGVPVGTYALEARREGFLTAGVAAVTVLDRALVTVDAMTLAPFQIDVEVAGGATHVASATVEVTVDAPQAAEVRLSSSPLFEGASWQAAGSALPFALAEGDGERVVYAQARASDGTLSAVVSDAIVLDMTAPVLVEARVGDSSGFITSASGDVSVALQCVDNLPGPLTATLTDETGGTLYDGPLLPLVTASLGATEGERGVTARCVDQAGNEATKGPIPVVVDRTPPAVTTFLLRRVEPALGPAHKTRELVIEVDLAVSDAGAGGAQVAVSDAPLSCATAAYTAAPAGALSFRLSPGDGNRQLYVCARDAAGNESAASVPSSNALVVDTTPPAVPGIVRSAVSDTAVDIAWSTPSDPDLGGFVLQRALEGVGAFETLTPSPGAADSAWSDPVATSELGLARSYRIAAVDDVGNQSSWSLELSGGVPFAPPTVEYADAPLVDAERLLVWDRPPGTAFTVGSYRYEVAGEVYEQPIAPTAQLVRVGARHVGGLDKVNERLVLTTSNRDYSLTWLVEYRFGNQRAVVSDENVQKLAAASGPDGVMHYLWWYPDQSLRYQRGDDGVAETIEADSTVTDLELAVDDDGVAHVAYLLYPSRIVRYRRLAGAQAPVDVDDGSGDLGELCLAVDASGTAHLGMSSFALASLDYAVLDAACQADPTTCLVTSLDTGTGAGDDCNIAVDDVGGVHLAHLRQVGAGTSELRYVRVGDAPVTIAAGGQNGVLGRGFAVDGAGQPHLVYGLYDGTEWAYSYLAADDACRADLNACAPRELSRASLSSGDLAIALDGRVGLKWVYVEGQLTRLDAVCADVGTPCETAVIPGFQPNLSVDDDGVLHVVHGVGSEGVVHLAREAGTAIVPLAAEPWDYHYTLGVDGRGTVNIVYANDRDGQPDALLWHPLDRDQPITLDTGSYNYWPGHPHVDAQGTLHVAWHVDWAAVVRYAPLDGVTAPVTLPAVGDAYATVVGVDGSGQPHLLARDWSSNQPSHLLLDDGCLAAPATGCDATALPTVGSHVYGELDAGGDLHYVTARFAVSPWDIAHSRVTPSCLAGAATCPPTLLSGDGGNVVPSFAFTVDAARRAHVVYKDGESGNTHHAIIAEDGVTTSVVDVVARTEVPLELTAGPGGELHLLFRDDAGSSPWTTYYTRLGALAPRTTVGSANLCEARTDDDGRFHAVCYSQGAASVLRGRPVRTLLPVSKQAL